MLLALFLMLCTPTQGRCQVPEQDEMPPDAELLEFLGSFEDKDSGWVDPFDLETPGGKDTPPREDEDAPQEEDSDDE